MIPLMLIMRDYCDGRWFLLGISKGAFCFWVICLVIYFSLSKLLISLKKVIYLSENHIFP